MSNRAWSVIAVAGLAAAAVGCGGDDAPSTQPTSPPVLAIDGMTYLSETVTGHELVEGSRLRLSFDGGNVGADAGCNQMGGAYEVVDGTLVVEQMSMTEMACIEPPGLMEQEQWYAEFLTSRPSITQDGDRLTVATPEVTVVFLDREIATPDLPLEGTTWTVDAAIDADTVSSVASGGSLVFDDGTVQVATGCNTGSGSYELSADGTSITFGPIGLTRMACADDEVARLEQAMTDVLQGTVAVEIEVDGATLTRDDVGLHLTGSG